jgi:hypothetical protein
MGHSVVARLIPESSADLVVEERAAVAGSVSKAVKELKPKDGDFFGIWEVGKAGDAAPSKEAAEEHVQSVLPACVMVFRANNLWMLDDSHIDCVRQSCRG